ncbi:AraC-like DNA-binding protein/quercetin dioxygenase-like cupin family protein [Caldicoprobacter guelmensis]|uniref:AraC family transcriptional regulator n=1 Tax=Caldicoprobacter guelmensis TaxID=1170224 RepID=UPI001A9CB0AE|nr:AraC family transcriptional regulator [Caldicoprobacter guelmensis]MBM7583394.1 AraC-like DNA-binding protein/quercetin dioxygenase-like cupin family protein [Caldicoprobacter guelmensis]
MSVNRKVEYPKIPLNSVIEINEIVSLFYFEYAKDFVFEGESHDFWEFLYVDKGQVEVMADTEGYQLEQGEMIFHKPNEFHSVWANGKIAPNLIVVSFVCNSPAMKFFENKILKAGDEEKAILAKLIKERANCFNKKLNEFITVNDKRDNELFGAQQLIKIYLELLLITLIRNNTVVKRQERISSLTRRRAEDDLVNRMICFMTQNIEKNLTVDDFCREFSLSRSRIKSLFREKMHTGVMQYFRRMKIERAKELIREENYNFSEIAEKLGFSSVHYFSHVFKKITDMSPSEYAISVKSKAELPNE